MCGLGDVRSDSDPGSNQTLLMTQQGSKAHYRDSTGLHLHYSYCRIRLKVRSTYSSSPMLNHNDIIGKVTE